MGEPAYQITFDQKTGELDIPTPAWAEPLLEPARYKGAYGGRSGGKSHFFAESIVEAVVLDPDTRVVCIREIQKTLKHSAKSLIEAKIREFGVSHLFKITDSEIKRIDGNGLIIFQGMQDHTADSIKSLEGFDIAWVEEAQTLSHRSLRLLRPTIRKDGSEIWFSWNPEFPTDAVDVFLRGENGSPNNSIVVSVNYYQNPFISKTALEEMEHDRETASPEDFAHTWLGEYATHLKSQIFSGKWEIGFFEPSKKWDGPYQGLDFGFSNDPTAAVRCWIDESENVLYIEREAGTVGLELDDTADHTKHHIPDFDRYTTRADDARPESISFLKRHGLPKIVAVVKGKGSVIDGIEFIKTFKKIVIHERCRNMIYEATNYCYETNRAGDILSKPKDSDNHWWDAVRYALQPLIKTGNQVGAFVKTRRRRRR